MAALRLAFCPLNAFSLPARALLSPRPRRVCPQGALGLVLAHVAARTVPAALSVSPFTLRPSLPVRPSTPAFPLTRSPPPSLRPHRMLPSPAARRNCRQTVPTRYALVNFCCFSSPLRTHPEARSLDDRVRDILHTGTQDERLDVVVLASSPQEELREVARASPPVAGR